MSGFSATRNVNRHPLALLVMVATSTLTCMVQYTYFCCSFGRNVEVAVKKKGRWVSIINQFHSSYYCSLESWNHLDNNLFIFIFDQLPFAAKYMKDVYGTVLIWGIG